MPQSLACLNVHLIFSTKHRARLLHDEMRNSLHSYMATVLKNFACHSVIINSVEDHIHLLFGLGRTVAVSTAVQEVKTASSKWIKTQGTELKEFARQGGCAAYAVSQPNVAGVREYVDNQREHHRIASCQQEYHMFLERNGVEYDERYMWD